MTGYCIDTSALMDAWVRYYPREVFPSLWERLENLIAEERLFAPDEVLRELEKKDDDLHAWAKLRPELFVPFETDIQEAAKEIINAHPQLVKAGPKRGSADPYVIALAKVRGLTVVAAEGDKPGKIPHVCRARAIRCVRLIDMFRELRWTI